MAARTGASCVHEWDIAPAAAHTSLGTCRKCGEVRDFENSCDQVLEQVASGRTLDFRAPRQKEVAARPKRSMVSRHKEIEKRWPEIKAAIEEAGSLNRARDKVGISYEAMRRAAIRHCFDLGPYTPGRGRKAAPVRETDGRAFRERPAANGHDNIGELLIGTGLVMIGGWLKQREEEH